MFDVHSPRWLDSVRLGANRASVWGWVNSAKNRACLYISNKSTGIAAVFWGLPAVQKMRRHPIRSVLTALGVVAMLVGLFSNVTGWSILDVVNNDYGRGPEARSAPSSASSDTRAGAEIHQTSTNNQTSQAAERGNVSDGPSSAQVASAPTADSVAPQAPEVPAPSSLDSEDEDDALPRTARGWYEFGLQNQEEEDWADALVAYSKVNDLANDGEAVEQTVLDDARVRAASLRARFPTVKPYLIPLALAMEWLWDFLNSSLLDDAAFEQARHELLLLFSARSNEHELVVGYRGPSIEPIFRPRPWPPPAGPAITRPTPVIVIAKCPEPNTRWLEIWWRSGEPEIYRGWLNLRPLDETATPVFGSVEEDAVIEQRAPLSQSRLCPGSDESP